jgi:hypothetical protein
MSMKEVVYGRSPFHGFLCFRGFFFTFASTESVYMKSTLVEFTHKITVRTPHTTCQNWSLQGKRFMIFFTLSFVQGHKKPLSRSG